MTCVHTQIRKMIEVQKPETGIKFTSYRKKSLTMT